MRIAYVCADRGIPFLGSKGASVHMREMASALAARADQVVVACARVGAGNPPPPSVDISVLPESPRDQREHLEAILRRCRIDAVLERYSLESETARRASAALGLPLVLELNAPLALEASRYRGLRDLDGALARELHSLESADGVIVVSGRLADYVRGRSPGAAVWVVPNGVDRAKFAGASPAPLGLPEGSSAVGFVGSMKPWHGVHDLLEAFRAVAAGRPAAHLVLAGEGPEQQAIQEAAGSGALRGRVHLLGNLPHGEVPGLLASLSMAVAPYPRLPDFYFSPLKVMEYLAAGLPVVYSSVGDLPDIVDGAGIGCRPGDPAGLAEAIGSLIENSGLRARLAARARERSRTFTWDAAAGRVTAVMDSLVSTRREEDRCVSW